MKSSSLGSLLAVNGGLLTHGGKNDDVWERCQSAYSRYSSKIAHTGVLAVLGEHLVDLVTNLAVRKLDILLLCAVVAHEGKEAIVGNVNLGKGSTNGWPNEEI